jgi:hypothetical protein
VGTLRDCFSFNEESSAGYAAGHYTRLNYAKLPYNSPLLISFARGAAPLQAKGGENKRLAAGIGAWRSAARRAAGEGRRGGAQISDRGHKNLSDGRVLPLALRNKKEDVSLCIFVPLYHSAVDVASLDEHLGE